MEHPVGLAAGFDKNGRLVRHLLDLGFGFVEVGSVTPKPQPGNPRPRIKKFFSSRCIVNAMGMNNDGMVTIRARLAPLPIRIKQKVLVNISKNKDTQDWLMDIRNTMTTFWFDCGGLVVNLSSPNTPGLRGLQTVENLELVQSLYWTLKQTLGPSPLYPQAGAGVFPLLATKLSPDLAEQDLRSLVRFMKSSAFGAVVLTNTTVDYPPEFRPQFGGGLSGSLLKHKSDHAIQIARSELGPDYPIIGVGGIMTPEHSLAKQKLGATAIELYSGFVFSGPELLWNSVSLLAGKTSARSPA
jgi:dihydroorotate dehydrogenase